jgi:lambda family phage portal protein
MGFWDRFKRKTTAPQMPAKRSFDAAKPDRLATGFNNLGRQRSANEDVRWNLRGLIAHSRQQAQNNDYMKRFLALVASNVVGPFGIAMQNQAKDTNKKPDKFANEMVETGWLKWGKKANCSLDGESSWRRIEQLTVKAVARDGTALLRLYRGKDFGPFGFQIQPLEIDFLDIDKNQAFNSGGGIRMGIEYDANGRKVAYHLFARHPGDYLPGGAGDRIRVPADQIIKIMLPDRFGQLVGVPWAHSGLRRLNMLRGFEEASITAARVGAAQMGFYQKPLGADDLDPASIDAQEQTDTGHLIKDMEAGIIETLPPGYEFKGMDSKYPTGEMAPFMRTMLQGAAAGLNISYASLSNDLSNANFSSMRAGQQPERDEWKTLQQWLIEELHEEIFKAWLPMAFLSGEMGNLPMSKIDKFAQPLWRPRGWAYVQPGDESTANQRDMASMLRSPQEIVAERGGDLEDVFREIKDAKDLAQSYGLEFNPMAPGHETPVPMATGDTASEADAAGADAAKPKKSAKPAK